MTRVNPRMGFFSVKCTHEQNATFKHQKLWISIKLWILHYKLWILSYKLRAVEAKSTFSLGSGGGEKKAGGREPNVSAALALISTACFTLSCSAWGKNSRVTGQSWKPENLWKMASWLASPEAELRQRFLGKSFERVLQETKNERIGQGKQLSKEVCGGETSCGLTLQWWHSGGLAAPRGALLEARFPSVSHWLKAVGKWWLGVLTSQIDSTVEIQVNSLEKATVEVFYITW